MSKKPHLNARFFADEFHQGIEFDDQIKALKGLDLKRSFLANIHERAKLTEQAKHFDTLSDDEVVKLVHDIRSNEVSIGAHAKRIGMEDGWIME